MELGEKKRNAAVAPQRVGVCSAFHPKAPAHCIGQVFWLASGGTPSRWEAQQWQKNVQPFSEAYSYGDSSCLSQDSLLISTASRQLRRTKCSGKGTEYFMEFYPKIGLLVDIFPTYILLAAVLRAGEADSADFVHLSGCVNLRSMRDMRNATCFLPDSVDKPEDFVLLQQKIYA